MKAPDFFAKLPNESVNVTHQRPLRSFFKLLSRISLLILGLYLLLALITRAGVNFISHDQERALFEYRARAEAAQQPSIWPDKAKIQSLVDKLLAHYPATRPDWIFSTCSKDANAFAAPGLRLIVTSGLLNQIQTEIGLSLVLAHELGHIHKQHALKSLGSEVAWALLTTLLGLQDDTIAGQLSETTSLLSSLSFSRDQEREADAIAIEMLLATYGHLEKSEEFFELALKEKENSAVNFTILSTHPDTAERLERIKKHPRYKNNTPTLVSSEWTAPKPPASCN
ncbi:MAG: M48 family metallopeptidase [Bdellovibrionales bacterium]|nr:M48 family metallopeptidase [Bdellovibrionales bacterium]